MNVVFQKIRFALYFLNTKPQTKKMFTFLNRTGDIFLKTKLAESLIGKSLKVTVKKR